MRSSKEHNYAVIELTAMLMNNESRNKTIAFINECNGITFKVINDDTIKLNITSSTETIDVSTNIFSLTSYTGIIDLLVDAIMGKRPSLEKVEKFYDFRDSLVTHKEYQELLLKYIKLLKKNNLFDDNIDSDYHIELDPLFADLNQLFIESNKDYTIKGIVVLPRKHHSYKFITICDDIEEYHDMSKKVRYSLYSYLKGAYEELLTEYES